MGSAEAEGPAAAIRRGLVLLELRQRARHPQVLPVREAADQSRPLQDSVHAARPAKRPPDGRFWSYSAAAATHFRLPAIAALGLEVDAENHSVRFDLRPRGLPFLAVCAGRRRLRHLLAAARPGALHPVAAVEHIYAHHGLQAFAEQVKLLLSLHLNT